MRFVHSLHTASCSRTCQARAVLLISRTFERGERARERDAATKTPTGTMLTFRKRVRSASTVISVFSEWPESLGPAAQPRRESHLDSPKRGESSVSRSVWAHRLSHSSLLSSLYPCRPLVLVLRRLLASDEV